MLGQSQVSSSSSEAQNELCSSHLTQLWEMPGNLTLQAQTLQPAWPERKKPTATVTPEA